MDGARSGAIQERRGDGPYKASTLQNYDEGSAAVLGQPCISSRHS